MVNFEVIKVATCGCEILNENNQVIGWSVDDEWGKVMTEALLSYYKRKNYEKYETAQPANTY